MNARFDLTDELIRRALTPPEDDAMAGLAQAIRSDVDLTPQRRHIWAPLRTFAGPFGPPRTLRLALILLVAALAIALMLALAGSRRPALQLGDGSMFHGGPARTGEMVGPGPAAAPTQLWAVDLPGPLANSMPALKDGHLFVADGRGNVGVYDPGTGSGGWTRSLPHPATSPAAADGVLIVGAGDGLYGVDETSGGITWMIRSDGPVTSHPAIVEHVAYAGFPDASVVAVDVKTGSVRWRRTIDGPITKALAVADGLVFAGDDAGQVAALDATDGTVRWSRSLGGGTLSSPAVSGGAVRISTGLGPEATDHRLYALDVRSGDILWSFEAPTKATLYVGAASSGGVTFAVSEDGHVYAVKDGGGLAWSFDTGGPVGSVGTISSGLLYVSSSAGRIFALDLLTGRDAWSVPVKGDPGPVIVADGRMYVGTSLGQLTAFGSTGQTGTSPGASP